MHVGNYLRDAFACAVEEGWPDGLANVDIDFRTKRQQQRWDQATVSERARLLTGWLWICSDILPGMLCDELDLHRGSTYAVAAHRLRSETTHPGLPESPAES